MVFPQTPIKDVIAARPETAAALMAELESAVPKSVTAGTTVRQ